MEDEDEIIIDTKSKIFFAVFFCIIASMVGATYYRFIYAENYPVEARVQCDPTREACFIHVCDPTERLANCTGDLKKDTIYYKAAHRVAKNIFLCDYKDENCDALVCRENEVGCKVALCDESALADSGDTCNDPEAYTASLETESDVVTPESADCATGDTECLPAQ